jgi:RES domain-containing protein
MIVYRITGRKFANDINGTGAASFGGRWNKKGTPVLYTGESKEIALLETIVHIPPLLVPDLAILTLEIPDHSISTFEVKDLPLNWSVYPAPTILAYLGEDWVKSGSSIALKVPSCVIHSAFNYILNCRHPDYLSSVKIIDLADFHFDSRLNS